VTQIRLPNITEVSEAGQLRQIKSYLHQLADELNHALSSGAEPSAAVAVREGGAARSSDDSTSSVNTIKSLIIKDATVVTSLCEEITKRLEGVYVAESDFGKYKEETAVQLSATSKSLEATFSNVQKLSSDVDGISQVLRTEDGGTMIIGSEAWAKIGILGYDEAGFAIYGMEIGQLDSREGTVVQKKFAQYRSDGVHLYDQNGSEVARISYNRLYVTGGMHLGSFFIDTSRGFTLKYIE
jgi:hypothetical protein